MGLLDDDGLGAAFGNEMLRRRATNERARMLARQQEPSLPPDINSSQFPRVNAAIQGLLGTAPDEMGISVLNPQAESIKAAADPAYVIGMALQGLPIVGGALKALGAGPKLAAGAESYMGRMGMMSQLDVYHGTPHRLPPTPRNPLGEFDASKIGTGEGAQVYGHGIYTAENPAVAQGYKDTLAYKAFDISPEAEKLGFTLNAGARGEFMRQSRVNKSPEAKARSLQNANIAARDVPQEKLAELFKAYEERGGGNLYKIDLPDEKVAKMLDWDKHLSEQSPEVQKILMPYQKEIGGSFGTGEQTLKAIAFERRMKGLDDSPAAVSQQLRDMGIPGIKYLDATSRDAGKGTRNFVTFPGEEKKMTILERNGQGLTDEEKKRQLAGLLYP